jgi:phosphatidylinositol glycan class M
MSAGSRVWLGLGALVPQAVLLLWMSLSLGRDLPAAVALQTLVFVTFNKVCTGQYFLW